MLPRWSDSWTVDRQGSGNDKDDEDDDAAWPCKERERGSVCVCVGVIRNHGGRLHYVPANVQIEVSGDSVEEGHYGSSQSGGTRK